LTSELNEGMDRRRAASGVRGSSALGELSTAELSGGNKERHIQWRLNEVATTFLPKALAPETEILMGIHGLVEVRSGGLQLKTLMELILWCPDLYLWTPCSGRLYDRQKLR